jgi:hypothetical protein
LAPDLFALPGAVLVVEGCGATASIPLDVTPPDGVPTLTDLSTDGTQVLTRWSVDPIPAGVISATYSDFVGNECHDPGGGQGRVVGRNIHYAKNVSLRSISGPTVSSTPWGVAYGWATTQGSYEPAMVPGPPELDVLRISDVDYLENPAILIDGVKVGFTGWIWGVRVLPNGELGTVVADRDSLYFKYEAGEAMDTIRRGAFVATFPHVVPKNDLDLWKDGDLLFDLELGPLVLVHEDDPSMTQTLDLAMRWNHRPVARIVPPP